MHKIGRKSANEDTSSAGAPSTPPSQGTGIETPDTDASKHNSLKHKFSKVGHNFNKMMASTKAKTFSSTADGDDPTPERNQSEDTVEEPERKSSKFGMMSTASLKMKLNKIAQSTKEKMHSTDTSADTGDAHTSIETDASRGEEGTEEHSTKRGSVLTGVTKGFHKIANKVNTKFKQEAPDETQQMDVSVHSDAEPAPIDMLEFEASDETPSYSYQHHTPQSEKTQHKSLSKLQNYQSLSYILRHSKALD